jgi:hypothetical protein
MIFGAGRAPLARLLTAAPLALAGSAGAAEWTFAPSTQIFSQVQDNPRLEVSSDETATGAGAQASFDIKRRTERLDLALRPTVGLQRYWQKNDLDQNNQQLTLTGEWRGERSVWAASAAATRDSTLNSELGNTGLTQLNRRHQGAVVNLSPSWMATERLSLGSSIEWEDNRYPGDVQGLLRDTRYETLAGSASYSVTDRTALSLIATAGRLFTEGSTTRTDTSSVVMQMRWLGSSTWSATLGAGPSWTRAGGRNEPGVLYNVSLARGFERSSLTVNAIRTQSPSGRGDITELDSAGLSFSHQMTEHVSGSASMSFAHRRTAIPVLARDIEDVRYARAEGSVAWNFRSGWNVAMSLGHSAQRAGVLTNDGTARGSDVRLTLSWTGEPYVN